MKKAYIIGIVALLIIGLLTWGIGPAMAQGGDQEYKKIDRPLSPVEGDDVYSIPPGSVIYQLDGGITVVHGPDGARILSARDSEASTIMTPGGPKKATHVHHVPSGSVIDSIGNTTKVYKNKTRILTVVNQSKHTPPPSYNGWIEWAEDASVAHLDYFYGKWYVPSVPPHPNDDALVYLFNAICPDGRGKIIQPVLEWNYGGTDRWTGAAWWVSTSDDYRASPVNASVGNEIWGTMAWDGFWYVDFYNRSTGEASWLTTTIFGTDDLEVFVALEGYDVYDDGDVPGDTTFDNMDFEYVGQDVDITWVPEYGSGSGLTGLNVVIYSDSKVKLETAN